MATITKTGARKPLASGKLYLSRSDHPQLETTFTLYVLAGETELGASRFIKMTISADELARINVLAARLEPGVL